ncbi:hypothetical protein SAMN05216588_11019 [Pseudomonas flavescens]|uniref:Uncharacterized protein n=1 Tax=Phytopseudomonas flavescens TaxID=29435 RepID=A0A1G8H220_9GAMM|nr:hypothetical protein [Pseudomonas flavescens]SDI00609.1 hypothetical protein SAMN05216588_11019 [Pseudomonas flavescens]
MMRLRQFNNRIALSSRIRSSHKFLYIKKTYICHNLKGMTGGVDSMLREVLSEVVGIWRRQGAERQWLAATLDLPGLRYAVSPDASTTG